MIPSIYSHDYVPNVSGNRLCYVYDCISGDAECSINGNYEITMTIAESSIALQHLLPNNIIYATRDASGVAQPYRIYKVVKNIDGTITAHGRNVIQADLSGIPMKPISGSSLSAIIGFLNQNTFQSGALNNYTITTEYNKLAPFSSHGLRSALDILIGSSNSLLGFYGGEIEYNGFSATIKSQIGQNSGAVIRYGLNMTDFEVTNNIANCYTGAVAFWYNDQQGTTLSNIVNASGTFDYSRIVSVDLTDKFESKPTVAQLTSELQVWMAENDVGVPDLSIDLAFVDLTSVKEYATSPLAKKLYLGDTVNVDYSKIGVTADARVVKTTWDFLNDRYISIQVGKEKVTIADTIAGLIKKK